MEGLVVVDLKERVVYANIKTENYLYPLSVTKNEIEDLATKFDYRIYNYNIEGFLEMKENLERDGFKFTEKEEEGWDDFLTNFEGNNHIMVENA